MGHRRDKRPWVAAVLGACVTGLGHLYLRRWWRALGWVAIVAATIGFFLGDGALAGATPHDVVPVVLVVAMSVVDAVIVARDHNRAVGVRQGERCPACARRLRMTEAFCWYCASRVEDAT